MILQVSLTVVTLCLLATCGLWYYWKRDFRDFDDQPIRRAKVVIEHLTFVPAVNNNHSNDCEYTFMIDGVNIHCSQHAPCLREGNVVNIEYLVGKSGRTKVQSMNPAKLR